MGLKQARSCFVFPREFSSLFRVSRVQLGLLRSFSCGDLRWLASLSRDVTGKALLRNPLDFVAPLRLWHSLRPPPMVGLVVESPAGRLPGQPCARLSAPSSGAPESCKREEKRARRSRVVFSTVRFGRRPPAADRIRLSVWGGAPPMSMVFLQGIFNGEKNNF